MAEKPRKGNRKTIVLYSIQVGGMKMSFIDDIIFAVEDGINWVKEKGSDIKDEIEYHVDDVIEAGTVGRDIVTGKFIADAAAEQVNEDIERLNKINSENEKMVKEVNDRIKKVQKEYEGTTTNLVEQKKRVYLYILKPYHELMSKLIADSRFTDARKDVIKSHVKIEQMNNVDFRRSFYDGHTLLHAITGTSTVSVVKSIATSIKIEYEIDDAKEERERLKAQKEKIYAQCKGIEEVTEFLKSSYKVVEELKVNAEEKMKKVKLLINNKGNDCSFFSSSDISLLKNCTNTVILLNQIVNTQLVNEEGIINPIYKKYIQQQMNGEKL